MPDFTPTLVEDLDPVDGLADTDLLPIAQGSGSLRRATVAAFRAQLLGGASNAATATAEARAASMEALNAADAAGVAASGVTVAINAAASGALEANAAAARANAAAETIENEIGNAQDAADAATTAAGSANAIATAAQIAAASATSAAGLANTKAALADTKATLANTKAALADDAASAANAAVADVAAAVEAAENAVIALGTAKDDAIAAAANAGTKATLADNAAAAATTAASAAQAVVDGYTADLTGAKSRANHTGTQSADTIVDGSTNKAFTAPEKAKLSTVQERANHTGTQAISTVAGLQTVLDAKAPNDLTAPGVGALPQSIRDRIDSMEVYATSYGLGKAGNTPAQELAAMKKAVAAAYALGSGWAVVVPAGVDATLDVTGGLSQAVLLDQPITIRIYGTLRANAFVSQSNPRYMFKVTSPNVVIDGGRVGKIAGDGTTDSTNSGDITIHPGLIYVSNTANYFVCRNITIEKPPKVGIVLAGCVGALLHGIKWTEGAPTHTGTGNFGVIASGGGYHVFENWSAPVGTGGARYVNLVFTSGVSGNANGCIMRNCSDINVWEKIFYGHGNDHVLHNCYGTGFATDWIRFMDGTNCRAEDCVVTGSAGFAQVLDATHCRIINCSGFALTQIAVNVTRNVGATFTASITGTTMTVTAKPSGTIAINSGALVGLGANILPGTTIVAPISVDVNGIGTWQVSNNHTTPAGSQVVRTGYMGGFNGTKVIGGEYEGVSVSTGLQDGIRVLSFGANSSDIIVRGVRLRNFAKNTGEGMIRILADAPFSIERAFVIGNDLSESTRNAIVLDRVIRSVVQGNTGMSITEAFLKEVGGAFNRWLENTGRTIGIKGVSGKASNSQAKGNTYTDGVTEGLATLVAGTVTVSTVEVLAGDMIELFRQTPGGTGGILSAPTASITAGTSFVINSRDTAGVIVADTSTVFWRLAAH